MNGYVRRFFLVSGTLSVLAVLLLSGCAPSTDYSARFVRYGTDEDGQRIAVITPLAEEAEEQTAFTRIDDLEPGEEVYIHYTGKDWDQPRDMPEREIVSRAKGR